METKVSLGEHGGSGSGAAPPTLSLDQVPSSHLHHPLDVLSMGRAVPITSLTLGGGVGSLVVAQQQQQQQQQQQPFSVREFIMSLAPRFAKVDAAERIADAMEREEITKDTLPLMTIELLTTKLGARNLGEALIVARAVQDLFRAEGITVPSPKTPRRKSAPADQVFTLGTLTGMGGSSAESSPMKRMHDDNDLNSVTAPSKRSRLLAAAVVNCAQGACASICRVSFRETFPLNEFTSWEAVSAHLQPTGENTLMLWATRVLQEIHSQLKDLAIHIKTEHILAWAREYHNNRKSYKKNIDKVKERSKRRYMHKGELNAWQSDQEMAALKDLEKEEISVAVLHVHDAISGKSMEQPQ